MNQIKNLFGFWFISNQLNEAKMQLIISGLIAGKINNLVSEKNLFHNCFFLSLKLHCSFCLVSLFQE